MAIDDQEFELNGTSYRINKMRALAGWHLLEKIRREAGRVVQVDDITAVLNADPGSKSVDELLLAGTSIISLLLRLEPEFVEKQLMGTMFKNVLFTNQHAETPQTLLGAEDMAFAKPTDPYEVLARCVAVNFTDSFVPLVRNLLGGLSDSLPSSLRQSPPSL